MRPFLLVVAVLAALGAASPATAQDAPPTLEQIPAPDGRIALRIHGAPNSTVSLYERAGDAVEPIEEVLLDAAGHADRPEAAAWRCDRRTRELSVSDSAQRTATVVVETPSCRDRLDLSVSPGRPRAGRPVTVGVHDRWALGDLEPRICARGPGGKHCGTVRWGESRRRAAFRFTPKGVGRWRVKLSGQAIPDRRKRVRVVSRRGGLRILAAGDSMIQYVDTSLAQRVRPRARVRTDDHISTGISKPSMLNWMAQAERMARSYRPDATVMFIGANDGFPIGGESCCGRGWIEGYAARARRMMRSYARGGAGAVYWLTLPVPNRSEFKPIYRAVNHAVRLAARRYPGIVRVVDLEKVFTPGGRYRSAMRWRGRTVTVRQGDGVHLNRTGASIAASIVVRAMRRDGVL